MSLTPPEPVLLKPDHNLSHPSSSARDSVTFVASSTLDREGDEDVQSEFRHEAYGPQPGEEGWDKFEVRFEPDELANPHNWSRAKRWYMTSVAGLLVLNAYVAFLVLSFVTLFHFGRQHLCELGALRYDCSTGGTLRFRTRSWYPSHRTLRCGLLRRTIIVGTAIRAIRSKADILNHIFRLHVLPSGLCTFTQYGGHPHLSVPRRCFRSCASHK